jgi:polar amino acid transport system substrate-binding protein
MNLKKTAAFCVAALVLVSGVFASGGKQQSGGGSLTITPGVLTVGMEIGYPPMEYMDADGKPTGFDVQMAKAIGKKLGLEVQFVDTAWDGIFAGIDTGKYDCAMSAVTINDARLRAHNFTKPYMANTLAMVLLKDSKVTAQSPEECAGLNVAYLEESTADTYMTALAEKGLKFTPREYEKVIYGFNELELGRVEVVVTDLMVAYDYIAPADSPFKIVWKSTEDDKFGVCLKKGNDALTAEIDKALDALFADGTMLKISQDIFGMDMVSAARK